MHDLECVVDRHGHPVLAHCVGPPGKPAHNLPWPPKLGLGDVDSCVLLLLLLLLLPAPTSLIHGFRFIGRPHQGIACSHASSQIKESHNQRARGVYHSKGGGRWKAV